MQRASQMLDFIYELGGKLYLIGSKVCDIVDDPELTKLYWSYYFATHVHGFKDFEYKDISQYNRNKAREAYEALAKSCKANENATLEPYNRNLRDYLEEKYEPEINEQIECWIKARKC